MLEEVSCPRLGQGEHSERDEISDGQDRADTESRDCPQPVNVESFENEPVGETPLPLAQSSSSRDEEVTVPVPAPRRTKKANAGAHSNPHHVPRSACNAISLSPDVLSQLLTSMGAVFFREAVKEVRTTN